jgi:hypothetical protein
VAPSEAPRPAAEVGAAVIGMAGDVAMVIISGPRRKRIRWSPWRRSISERSCSFISSMNLRTFFTSNTSPGIEPEFAVIPVCPVVYQTIKLYYVERVNNRNRRMAV